MTYPGKGVLPRAAKDKTKHAVHFHKGCIRRKKGGGTHFVW